MHDFAGNPVNNAIMQQFDKQRLRGTQGFGVYDGLKNHLVKASKEDKILKWLCKYDSNLLLMHHRLPTSTINVKRAAHPFTTRDYFGNTQYILVHNGSIRNADELFVAHQELGIEYTSLLEDMTFNDSEALLWDFALFMEGKQTEMKAGGGIAFIALKLHKGKLKKLLFGRNTNPIKMIKSKEGIQLASELEGGEDIEPHTLYTWHYAAKRLEQKYLYIPGYTSKNWSEDTYTYRGAPQLPARLGELGAYCTCDYEDYCDRHGYMAGSRYAYDGEKGTNAEKLGNVLTRQFGHMFSKTTVNNLVEKNIAEYEQNTSGIYVPKKGGLDEVEQAIEDKRQMELELVEKRGRMPTEQEIEAQYKAYLAGVQGHFESAYWAMEVDYDAALEAPDTTDNMRKRILLEKLMEKIEKDPDFTSMASYAKEWKKEGTKEWAAVR